jgi:hypothetical protein
MAIAVLFEFPEPDAIDKYDQALETEPRTKDQPARSVHVCFELPGRGFGVLDVWDSEEAFARFGEVLGPVLAQSGLAGDPKIYRVHNTM